MSDIYVKDTKKAMEEFCNWFEIIKDNLRPEFTSDYETLISEVGFLLEQYEEKQQKIEELEGKIEELED